MLVNLKQEDILRLAQIVREETGNLVQEKNYSMLEARIRTHILKMGIQSMQDYRTSIVTGKQIGRAHV